MHTSFRFVTALVFVGALSSLSGLAGAQDSACTADMQKFCANIEPGAGRVSKCLGEHSQELSAGCRDQIKKATTASERFQQVCGEDSKKHCSSVSPGGGRVIQCLGKNAESLSAACKDALAALKKQQ